MPLALQRNQVEIALHHQGHPGEAQGVGGLGQAVEGAALGIELALRGVEVLGLALADNPAAEGDHPALPVEDGEDDAVPEAVVEAAALPGHQQAGVPGRLQREAAGLQMAAQGVPFLHGIAQVKGLDDLRREAAFGQIVAAGFARRRCSGWPRRNSPPPG